MPLGRSKDAHHFFAVDALSIHVSLEEEEQQWTAVKTRIESEPSADIEDDAQAAQTSAATYGLPVAKEIEQLQRNALQQIGTTANKVRTCCLCAFETITMCKIFTLLLLTQLDLVDDSVKSIDRLILQIEMKKATLFNTFHDSAFKGYANISHPKENLRALLKFAPPSTTGFSSSS